ncbi:AAA family ATPase [Acrocarpospora catenulata]|uniref:AAA family ATPase n=1 Tax=Acrocarpospora catenulata TaxID=2836182 RepID=UPI001BD9DBFE|nr:AAA family ATPase [Acrocarpospora catenulata]
MNAPRMTYEGLRAPGSGPDDRDPKTRKRMAFWDRSKIIIILGLAFLLLAVKTYGEFDGIMTFQDALYEQAKATPWLLYLIGLDALRQVHFLISERSAGYHRFWTKGVFGGFERWSHRTFSDWNRFRLARFIKWAFWITILAFVLAEALPNDPSPIQALFQAPALLWSALPYVAQLAFAFFFIMFQFIGLFWFLSKGGIETYFPDDIKTRFSDVWGQDHVVERVKENIVFLERPDEIEKRGGYVPSGLLLWGPPGTGKTLMAEAVAGETGKPYVFVDPGAFVNMFMGIGILKVKSLFRKLRKLALRYGGVIVFFDEADSLGRRGSLAQQGPNAGPRMSPLVDRMSCNGYSYMSSNMRSMLEESFAPPQEPARRRNFFMMGGNMMGGGGGDMGTLQALLTELSGLKKPRGIINRHVRRLLGMRPKPPPKYRILVMMATNMPNALDEALLRPGRIDRIYKVGYPSKAGRLRTYQGYFEKVNHEITDEQIEKLATITPYATGATIKDLVNESLIIAIRDGREVITWQDVIAAKHLKDLGPPEGVEYVERERHATAVHEACHAVMAIRVQRYTEIDLATIEKGAGYLGMVSRIPLEDQFTEWKSTYEAHILTSLASLAGERMFFGEDNSSGVSGDLANATLVAGRMESHWGMGVGIASLPALQDLGIQPGEPDQRRRGEPGRIGFLAQRLGPNDENIAPEALGMRVEYTLSRLLEKAENILRENRAEVLAVAHALETYKTLSGEDVKAVMDGVPGTIVDGRIYKDPRFVAEIDAYHEAALRAHLEHDQSMLPLPVYQQVQQLEPVGAGVGYPAAGPAFIAGEIVQTNGNGNRGAVAGAAGVASPDFVPWNGGSQPPPPPAGYAQPYPPPAPVETSKGRGMLWALVGASMALVVFVVLLFAAFGAGMTPESAEMSGGGLSTGTIIAFLVGILVLIGLIVAIALIVRNQQATRKRAEESRDRANERAQLLAAAMEPEVAMRLLGYDGRDKQGP